MTTLPKRSWNLPSPLLFTDSDPDAAHGRPGVACVATIEKPGERPTWIVEHVIGHPPGRIFQAEGEDQAAALLEELAADPELTSGVDTAIITNGLRAETVARFVAGGITSWMIECYAQPGDKWGMIGEQLQNARAHGCPRNIPVLGVFDLIDYNHYIHLNGGVNNFRHNHWRGGPLAVYLGEGMTDTNSWPTMAALQ
jgi:hypothetical protein